MRGDGDDDLDEKRAKNLTKIQPPKPSSSSHPSPTLYSTSPRSQNTPIFNPRLTSTQPTPLLSPPLFAVPLLSRFTHQMSDPTTTKPIPLPLFRRYLAIHQNKHTTTQYSIKMDHRNPQPSPITTTTSSSSTHSNPSPEPLPVLNRYIISPVNDYVVAPVVTWVRDYNEAHGGLPEGYEIADPVACRVCSTVTSLTDQMASILGRRDDTRERKTED